MPIIKIDYDKKAFSEEEIQTTASAIQRITADATGYGLDEVSVFARENNITINAAPIEIYIYATFENDDDDSLRAKLSKVAEKVKEYKAQNNMSQSFNLSIVKMHWKFELGV